jgi:hypothetical protein
MSILAEIIRLVPYLSAGTMIIPRLLLYRSSEKNLSFLNSVKIWHDLPCLLSFVSNRVMCMIDEHKQNLLTRSLYICSLSSVIGIFGWRSFSIVHFCCVGSVTRQGRHILISNFAKGAALGCEGIHARRNPHPKWNPVRAEWESNNRASACSCQRIRPLYRLHDVKQESNWPRQCALHQNKEYSSKQNLDL